MENLIRGLLLDPYQSQNERRIEGAYLPYRTEEGFCDVRRDPLPNNGSSAFVAGEDIPRRDWIAQPFQTRGNFAYFGKGGLSTKPQVRIADNSAPKGGDGGGVEDSRLEPNSPEFLQFKLSSPEFSSPNFPPTPRDILQQVLQQDVLLKLKGRYGNQCRFDPISLSGLGVVKDLTIFPHAEGLRCTPEDPINSYDGYRNTGGWIPKASFNLYLEGDANTQHDCNTPLVQNVLSRLFANGKEFSADIQERGEVSSPRLEIAPQTMDPKWIILGSPWPDVSKTLYIKEEGNFIYVEPLNKGWGLQCSSACAFDPTSGSVRPRFFMEILPPTPWGDVSKGEREDQAKVEEKIKEHPNAVRMTCQQAEDPEYTQQLYTKRLRERLSEDCKLLPTLCKEGLDKRFQDTLFALSGREARGIHTFADVFSSETLAHSYIKEEHDGVEASCYFDLTIPVLHKLTAHLCTNVGVLKDSSRPCDAAAAAEKTLLYRDGIVLGQCPSISGTDVNIKFDFERGSPPPLPQCSTELVKKVFSKILNKKTYGNDIQKLKQVATLDLYEYYDSENKGAVPLALSKTLREDTRYRRLTERQKLFANNFWAASCRQLYFLSDDYGVSSSIGIEIIPATNILQWVPASQAEDEERAQKVKGKKLVTFDYKDVFRAKKREVLAEKKAEKMAALDEKKRMRQQEQRNFRECEERGIPRKRCRATLLRLDRVESAKRSRDAERGRAMCEAMYYQCTAICEGFGDSWSSRAISCRANCGHAQTTCEAAY